MPRTKRELAVSRQLQKAIWRAERSVAKKVAAYEHLVKAAMLVRQRVPKVDPLVDARGSAGAAKRKRANMALAVLCRALDRLGR